MYQFVLYNYTNKLGNYTNQDYYCAITLSTDSRAIPLEPLIRIMYHLAGCPSPSYAVKICQENSMLLAKQARHAAYVCPQE